MYTIKVYRSNNLIVGKKFWIKLDFEKKVSKIEIKKYNLIWRYNIRKRFDKLIWARCQLKIRNRKIWVRWKIKWENKVN